MTLKLYKLIYIILRLKARWLCYDPFATRLCCLSFWWEVWCWTCSISNQLIDRLSHQINSITKVFWCETENSSKQVIYIIMYVWKNWKEDDPCINILQRRKKKKHKIWVIQTVRSNHRISWGIYTNYGRLKCISYTGAVEYNAQGAHLHTQYSEQ